jgi:UDP-N-acetylmuramoylalanine--D-glutamate ligase
MSEATSVGGEATSVGGEATSVGGEATSVGGEATSVGGEATSVDLAVPLVVGFGITGQAVAAVLIERGHRPLVVDDRPSEAAAAAAAAIGIDLITAPDEGQLAFLLRTTTVVLPSPGIPDSHPLFRLAAKAGVPVRSEFDLAAMWDDRPVVAITGTNGKTSVTMLVTAALEASGLRAVAVGNTATPLVAALADTEIEVFVVEASSFRLAHSHRFAPAVATWMNFAPDHLDAHADLETYRAAKASIWAHMPPGSTMVANAEDPTVMAALPSNESDCAVVTFGLEFGDWRIEDGQLTGPAGPIVAAADLARRQPHDLANAACAAATAMAAGATVDGVVEALRSFEGLPHRLALVGSWNDVAWFDDSKATVPQATLAAVSGFDSVVLIAGGRNKGLDLSDLANTVPPVHTVVAIGDAAREVVDAFAPTAAVTETATSMADAIGRAIRAAVPGDAVVLSPACTSFDWYDNYGQRGDHFASLVMERFSS